jgi:hypothetical protein
VDRPPRRDLSVTAGERIGRCPTILDRRGGVGAVDPPDQQLQLTQHLAGLGEQRGSVFGRRLRRQVLVGFGGDASAFDERRVGLDHVAFRVSDLGALEASANRLDLMPWA